jgi:uncharacterized protein (DUF2164 family)
MGLLRKWDTENKELNDQCVAEVITRVDELDGESMGMIAAQDIIDIVMSHYGPEVYNKAVRDIKTTLDNRFDDTLTDVDMMQV